MLLRSFRPLHIGWPAWAQAVLAPIQGLHLRLLSEWTLLPGSAADLESKLRPLLLPSEDWSDTGAWRGNTRLLAWLRSEVILRHPQTQRLLPAAEAELLPAGEQLPILPDAAMVRRLFERTRPDGDVRPPARRSEAGEAARDAAGAATRSAKGCTRHVSFAEVLHGAGGLVRGRGVLNAFCERHGFYEVLTQELVAALAAHIRARLPALQAAAAVAASCNPAEEDEGEEDGGGEYPVVILEVGAGSGALSFHLRHALRGEACEVVACDSGAQALPGAKYPLGEAMLETSHEAALRIARPSLVLCAWMPMGRDLSRAFRECDSVQEYVLLGEADDGACGDNWETWGNPAFNPAFHAAFEQRARRAAAVEGAETGGEGTPPPVPPPVAPPVAPHAEDGFARVELPALSRWMVSRYDGEGEGEACLSCAVAFVRQPAEEWAGGGGA